LSPSSFTLEAIVDIGILSYTKFLSSTSWAASLASVSEPRCLQFQCVLSPIQSELTTFAS
jgi:hypothetical protein